jgi:hypothetical protein
MVTIHLTPTNQLAIELQHISKKYPILSVFYRYQKRFKYHILAHMFILKKIEMYVFNINKIELYVFILRDVKQN